jgi:hypothetical protein
MQINYTTYDMRRAQDCINPRTHADVMVLSHEDENTKPHPYWYARVVGIFHFKVVHLGFSMLSSNVRHMEVLWVRWFGRDLSYNSGFKSRRLHRIGFIPVSDDSAFGFLDPRLVIRGIHLLPAFAHNQTNEIMGPSISRQPCEHDQDWSYYYINMFVLLF